ncbi:MAG: hypothetical protein IMF16_08825, partial [Proteobacteria bacterium]|nr:hypothetical protein [Pseudomonadota bacterium]
RVEEALPGALRGHVAAVIAHSGLAAGAAEVESVSRLLQSWCERHKEANGEAAARRQRLTQATFNMQTEFLQVKSPRDIARLQGPLQRDFGELESARMAEEYHARVGELLEQLEGQLAGEWQEALRQNAAHLQTILGERGRRALRHTATQSVAVAYHDYLWEERRIIWDQALTEISGDLLRTWSKENLELNMEDKCRAVLDPVDLRPDHILITPEGRPTQFLQAAMRDASPCWNPDVIASEDGPTVALVSIEANGESLPNIKALEEALQEGRGRDVEARRGFLTQPSFLVLRVDIGASVSYLAELPTWYEAYDNMMAELREGRATGVVKGRQPHTERRFESECAELVTVVRKARPHELRAFGLGLMAKAIGWRQLSLCCLLRGEEERMGADYLTSLVHCAQHNLTPLLEEHGLAYLRALGDNLQQASALEQYAARAEMPPDLPDDEREARSQVLQQLQKLAESLRQARG